MMNLAILAALDEEAAEEIGPLPIREGLYDPLGEFDR